MFKRILMYIDKNSMTRILIFTCAFLLLYGVLTESIEFKNSSRQREIAESFKKLQVELESSSNITDYKTQMADYSKLYNNQCNIIVTNKDNEVVFHLNDDYLPDKTFFKVASDSALQNVAQIMDKNNRIQYTAYFENVSSFNNIEKSEIEAFLTTDIQEPLSIDYFYSASKKQEFYVIYNTDIQNEILYNSTAAFRFFKSNAIYFYLLGILALQLFKKSGAISYKE